MIWWSNRKRLEFKLGVVEVNRYGMGELCVYTEGNRE